MPAADDADDGEERTPEAGILQAGVDGVIAEAVDEIDRGKSAQAVAAAIEEDAETAR